MKIIAIIAQAMVVNTALWDGITPWNPGSQYILVDVTNLSCVDGSPIQVGCSYDGTNFYAGQQIICDC